jgi:hypothetical protein
MSDKNAFFIVVLSFYVISIVSSCPLGQKYRAKVLKNFDICKKNANFAPKFIFYSYDPTIILHHRGAGCDGARAYQSVKYYCHPHAYIA